MNDFFLNFTKDPKKVAAARRFRHHVQTRSNPRGVIVRLPCSRCPIAEAVMKPSEAHHEDYDRWWLVVWLCESCHREIDHMVPKKRKLALRPSWFCDYSSLICRPGSRRGKNHPTNPLDKALGFLEPSVKHSGVFSDADDDPPPF